MIGSRNLSSRKRVRVSTLSERFTESLSSVFVLIRVDFNSIAHLFANNVLLYSLPFQVTIEVFEDEKEKLLDTIQSANQDCEVIAVRKAIARGQKANGL